MFRVCILNWTKDLTKTAICLYSARKRTTAMGPLQLKGHPIWKLANNHVFWWCYQGILPLFPDQFYLWISMYRKSLVFVDFYGITLEKAMAPHSSTLAWKIPWTEEPGRLQSMGSLRVGHDWATSFSLFTFHFHALEKAMATHSSVLAWRIPGMGEPVGLPSLGSHRIGHDWSDLAAAAAAWYNLCKNGMT